MRPKRDPRRHMNKFKMPTLTLPSLTRISIINLNLEKRIIVSLPSSFVVGYSGEFGVGGHERTCYIVGEEFCVGCDVGELDYVFVSDDSATPGFGEGFGRDDYPVVVHVVVVVASYLLT